MTDEIPVPSTPSHDAPVSERARVEPSPPPKRLDALPVLYLVGFLIMASALIYLWKHPVLPRTAALEVARADVMRQQIETLSAQVASLAARPQINPGPLEDRIAALEKRPPVVAASPGPSLAPLEAKIAALEARPLPAPPPPPVDLKPLTDRLSALEARRPVDLAPLTQRLDQLDTVTKQTDALAKQTETLAKATDAQAKQTASSLAAVAEKAQRSGRLQAAAAALEAGQRLGDIPNAPPALARFAHDAPPTESGLRLSFNKAAAAAHAASQPALTDNQPFLDRMWTRAQQAVTVRQGDHVIVGDPIAGVIERSRQALDAGDLSGAVKALDALAGPAKAAMADWTAQAKSLLDARAAIGDLAARS